MSREKHIFYKKNIYNRETLMIRYYINSIKNKLIPGEHKKSINIVSPTKLINALKT